jgi:hypothetical protein
MTHATGNATWADTPATSTLISASSLEKVEGAIDNLYISEYGAKTRTVRPVFVGMIQSNITVAGDYWISSGVVVIKNTDSPGWVVPGGTTPSYYQIPMSGRLWDIYWRVAFQTSPPGGGAVAGKICLNGTNVGVNTIATDGRASTNGESYPLCWRPGVSGLVAGDKLYFNAYSSGSNIIGPCFGWTYPNISIRDAGPV